MQFKDLKSKGGREFILVHQAKSWLRPVPELLSRFPLKSLNLRVFNKPLQPRVTNPTLNGKSNHPTLNGF